MDKIRGTDMVSLLKPLFLDFDFNTSDILLRRSVVQIFLEDF